MRTPFLAPIPVPTITAVGVARPRAHGQAITRTEMAYWKTESMCGQRLQSPSDDVPLVVILEMVVLSLELPCCI